MCSASCAWVEITLEKKINNDAAYSTWPASGYCNACLSLLEMCGQGMFSQKSICSAVKAARILPAVRIHTALWQVWDVQTVPALRCKRDRCANCPLGKKVTPHGNICWHTRTPETRADTRAFPTVLPQAQRHGCLQHAQRPSPRAKAAQLFLLRIITSIRGLQIWDVKLHLFYQMHMKCQGFINSTVCNLTSPFGVVI